MRYAHWLWLLLLAAGTVLGRGVDTFYVATGGDDNSGDGSQGNPWATITHAVDNATEGALILVAPGTYNGRTNLRQQFSQPVTVRSEVPYQAQLRHNNGAALISYEGQNIIVEGFDIAHDPANTGALVIQVQDLLGAVNGSDGGTDPVVSGIVFRNNIIHDSTNNDLLKINNGAENVLVEGNLFYHQSGSDEHMDVNSVIGVTIQDNVFFNTNARPNTSSFVVIKDSNGNDDTVLGCQDVIVRRNVFLNWHGSDGQSFLRLGEDGTANFEAIGIVAENNLMIGNSSPLMRTSFTVMGSSNVIYRNNTVTGDLPSRSFAARLIASGGNPGNTDIFFFNNLWSDPTGTMGGEGFNGVDVFDAPTGDTVSVTLDNNLYWNGGSAIPPDTGQFVTFADDSNGLFGDPLMPTLTGVVAPTWNGSQFADGSSTIREVFESLVLDFGVPGTGSAAIDSADPASSAQRDILNRVRGVSPDAGAYETNPSDVLYEDSFEALM